jgi:hypothetical protein
VNSRLLFWAILLFALVLFTGSVWVFTLKPQQPKGYQTYVCQEAWRGANDECLTKGLSTETCDDIASVAKHCCDGALPEKNAEP